MIIGKALVPMADGLIGGPGALSGPAPVARFSHPLTEEFAVVNGVLWAAEIKKKCSRNSEKDAKLDNGRLLHWQSKAVAKPKHMSVEAGIGRAEAEIGHVLKSIAEI